MDVRAVIKNIHDSAERESNAGRSSPSRGNAPDLTELRGACAGLFDMRNLAGQMPPQPPTTRGALGAHLVRAVRRMLFWYTPQIVRFHNQTALVAGQLLDALEKQAQLIADLQHEVQSVRRYANAAPAPQASGGQEAAPASCGAAFAFALQDNFRGSEEDTSNKLQRWFQSLEDVDPPAGPWLDIGCGRGEWLALARERGHAVTGIDENPLSVTHCEDRRLPAEQADAVSFLNRTADNSLSVITAFHVVEHLSMNALELLVGLAARKLKPGGLLAFETPDPANLLKASHYFWNDPTHQRPVPFDLLKWIFGYFGLSVVEHLHLNPFPEAQHLGFTEIEPVGRVNALLYGPRDYGIIGRREA